MPKGRILSGMRPTGKLHLGHLLGALENWRNLQEEYECFFEIADWHALSTAYSDTSNLPSSIREVLIDFISSGVDPERCVFFLQSDVKEICELHLLLSMIIPVSWVERCPSYKGQIQELGPHIATYGFLGYPVLQAADIMTFKADAVPVGEDQLPHLELTREIVRRFNHLYGDTFPEPAPKLTKTPLIPGLDGRKMSKSYNNYILISDPPDLILKKLKSMVTDTKKIYKNDVGRPEVCGVFKLHQAFNKADEIGEIDRDCREGVLGCVSCKKKLSSLIIACTEPILFKRRELEKFPQKINAILEEGRKKAQLVASKVLEEVRYKMRLSPALREKI